MYSKFNPRIGFDAVQVLCSARTVKELDFAYTVMNNSYQIIRGQIEIMELLRHGPLVVDEEDSSD